ncbi:MAG: hypothetical protein MUF49_22765 [Oculatellaceae cyanobacterium Prado106]|jgi:hypothetical protein|nr:hypothetical protein [Oculatellaceae cyanobacterium Prado106]
MNPDFTTLSRQELRAYVLAHRDDEEAFFAFVDRSEAEANWVEMPPIESIEDLQNFPEFLKRINPNHSD